MNPFRSFELISPDTHPETEPRNVGQDEHLLPLSEHPSNLTVEESLHTIRDARLPNNNNVAHRVDPSRGHPDSRSNRERGDFFVATHNDEVVVVVGNPEEDSPTFLNV